MEQEGQDELKRRKAVPAACIRCAWFLNIKRRGRARKQREKVASQ
jgi:hypothetical protein